MPCSPYKENTKTRKCHVVSPSGPRHRRDDYNTEQCMGQEPKVQIEQLLHILLVFLFGILCAWKSGSILKWAHRSSTATGKATKLVDVYLATSTTFPNLPLSSMFYPWIVYFSVLAITLQLKTTLCYLPSWV